MSHRLVAAVLLLALSLGAAPALGQASGTPQAPTAAQPQLPGASQPIGGTDNIRLRPGDVLRIIVYREPDLNGEFLIDEEGVVNLPLIGDQRLMGLSMRQVRERVMEAYRVHLRNPSIAVIPLRRIHVLGEVQRPGQYAIDPTVSLAGAVALAGGATGIGELRKIRVVRDGAVYRSRVGAAQTLSGIDIQSGDEIHVERRSWFDRNSTFIVSSMLSVTSIITSIILASTRDRS